jgi:hypothetical protein
MAVTSRARATRAGRVVRGLAGLAVFLVAL